MDQTSASSLHTFHASQGFKGAEPSNVKGPSVSGSTLSIGILAARPRPFSPANIAGPTLNQHPNLIAAWSSVSPPENQCRTGKPTEPA